MDYFDHFIIIHRDIGSQDESSTDEEQGDKILFFHPEDTSLYNQLSKLIMLESLIEFNRKFSKHSLEFVVMQVLFQHQYINLNPFLIYNHIEQYLGLLRM